MKPVVAVQHLEPETPGAIADAFTRSGRPLTIVRPDRGDPVPADATELGALVVMGGPMSARRDDGFASRGAELALLRSALAAEVPVLGVCLGAQLLAAAAGGEVVPGDGIEVGWAPITLSSAAATDPLFHDLPSTFDVLHWHGETYVLPDAATPLARSARYAQQAFRVGPCAWGLQFHLEVDTAAVDRFIEGFADEADQAADGAAGIRRATPAAVAALEAIQDAILGRFVRLAHQDPSPGNAAPP